MRIRHMIERCAQAAVIIVFKRNETERLQYSRGSLPHRAENLGHTVYRPRLRLKCNLNELALRQRTRQFQQAASNRDGLEFSFSVPAIF